MTEEGFLRRWSRRKAQSLRGDELPPEPASTPLPAFAAPLEADAGVAADAPAQPGAGERALPTLDDVARLTPDADFSSFVARDVDPLVRRSALKKLFADPHFHAMDGLDVYIDDYTKPSPVSEAMLATLGHARGVLRRLAADEPEDAPEPEQDTTINSTINPTINPEDETP